MAAERAAQPEISAEELATWWTPKEAARYAATCVGDFRDAQNGLWQRLVAGLIETAAATSSLTPKDHAPVPNKTPEIIPRRFWKLFSKHGSDFWNGDVRFFLPGSGTSSVFQAFGVRLRPDDVRECFPEPSYRFVDKPAKESEPAPDVASSKQNQGGRPRKDWWDDFWIEICRQIYEGDLKPKTQAELQEAMHQWVENHHDGDVGETTIKAAAKKLFKAWNLGSKT